MQNGSIGMVREGCVWFDKISVKVRRSYGNSFQIQGGRALPSSDIVALAGKLKSFTQAGC